MAFSTQPNFIGVLDGTDVNELNKKIDYSKVHLEERKEVVGSILDDTKFYEDYFSDHFKANINAGDHTSSNVNVCKSLERMANYLLNSKEIKEEEDKEKTQYVFHTDEKYFRKKVDRELSIDQMTNSENSDHENTIIHFLKRDDGNFKKEKIQSIDVRDIRPTKHNTQEDVEMVKSIILDYKNFYDRITEMLVTKDKSINRYLLTKVKGQLTDDMIYSKDHLLGIFGYDLKHGEKETSRPSLDIFDFTNMKHIYGDTVEFTGMTKRGSIVKHSVLAKGLMFFKPTSDMTNDFNLTLIDLENTIKKANLTDEESKVLSFSQNGMTLDEISIELHTYPTKISRILKRIAKKIVSVGDKYDLKNKIEVQTAA